MTWLRIAHKLSACGRHPGFPEDVRKVFKKCGLELFRDIQLLLAIPEYKVPFPGGQRASQNDIFVLATGNDQLVSIMVEGKVSEPFGQTIGEWRENASNSILQLRGQQANPL